MVRQAEQICLHLTCSLLMRTWDLRLLDMTQGIKKSVTVTKQWTGLTSPLLIGCGLRASVQLMLYLSYWSRSHLHPDFFWWLFHKDVHTSLIASKMLMIGIEPNMTLLLCNCELSTFAWGFHMTPRVCKFYWQVAWSQLKLVLGRGGGKKKKV